MQSVYIARRVSRRGLRGPLAPRPVHGCATRSWAAKTVLAAPDLLLDVEATQIAAIHLGAILVGLAFVVLRATKQAQRAIADRQTEATFEPTAVSVGAAIGGATLARGDISGGADAGRTVGAVSIGEARIDAAAHRRRKIGANTGAELVARGILAHAAVAAGLGVGGLLTGDRGMPVDGPVRAQLEPRFDLSAGE